MKYSKFALIFIVVFTACSTTTMLESWNQKGAPPKHYGRIAVVVISPNTQTRAVVEDAVSAQFKAKKINADPTFNTFPMAGQIGQINIDTAVLQQKIRERVTSNHFEGLLTIVLLDKQKEERYVEGSSITVGAPVYGYPYYGYYSYAYQTVYTSGYYVNTTSYFLESNLYDVASGKLIWTAQTKTENPASVEAEAPNYARLIVNDILTKKVIE
jgi:hypothetical protein